ncbi:FMN-dependent NADH-azoreductase 4 [Bacillus toyonensis]|jgi:FMN-dependent NADH-azoreductase|uniref:FMN dependent NADH:quinone oxidoreductase n=1 Tax=Bacillus toyonensis TaxID=155322 RepID=A0A2B6R2D8_9BACI|nr:MULTISPECIES: FMN-dependent NADH-azoreductase [Bacillus]EEL37537.1 FMN-dependent NADH-azoreductase 1 [Bacillus cereus Rock3-29]KAB0444309.1 FMN-dependent NADH-azoreductase 4 [Lysinibacillus sp. VIA-II-2016]KXY50824.1 FMN-dependent NADH-azoreductase [Bacillus cereus]ARC30498.1 FMN-dependent NADH-azoreductase 4 [Bacillus sp. FDAARGOS_235]EJQ34972.1 FMN-dependent NADH-azoreductase 4 [Bacillus toyonensis]
MATVLFVKANNRPAEQAVSVKLYEAFLANYKEAHPNDTVVELDLYKEELPYVGVDMINGTFKAGKGFDLTEEEAKAVAVADKYLNQFLEADKVVFGFPLWNLTIPAVLHTYIDYLNRAGKTFKYTPEGPVGLIGDKKIALLNARGGVYSEGPATEVEMAVKYVASMMGFFGATNMETVVIEGHNQFPDKAEEIITAGLEEAAKVASKF